VTPTPDGPEGALLHALEHAAHALPAQGPIGIFVHHNTLHAFEHLPFEQAVVEAASLFGAEPFPSEAEQRAALARGRILRRDLEQVLRQELGASADEVLIDGVTRLELHELALLHAVDEPSSAAMAWQVEEGQLFAELDPALPKHSPLRAGDLRSALGALFEACSERFEGSSAAPPKPRIRLRDALLDATGEDTDAFVHPTLIHVVSAFLDQGIAYWPMPGRERGLYVAARELLAQPFPPPNAWVRRTVTEMQRQIRLGMSALDIALEVLADLGLPAEVWPDWVQGTLLALPGWAGMIRQLELRPDRAPVHAPPASLLDFLALRLTLERDAARFVAQRRSLPSTPLSALLDAVRSDSRAASAPSRALEAFLVLAHAGVDADSLRALDSSGASRLEQALFGFGSLRRRRVWQLAFELRHRHQVLDALAAHCRLPRPSEIEPKFQAIFCIDERSESLRRHLEEVAPEVETWGAAGFFGVAMYYRGVDDAHSVPLCPVAITPKHEIHEHPLPGGTKRWARRRAQRRMVGRFTHGADVGSRTFLRGTIWSAALGVLSAAPLVLRVIVPRAAARFGERMRELSLPSLETTLDLVRQGDERTPDGRLLGFSTDEMADIVAGVLSDMGLTRRFAPIVLVVGHGSASLNNPHESAHDCGACGGGRGGPNARAFAQMANHPEVRDKLAERGLVVPHDTVFVGAYHDTCNDSVTLFDRRVVPDASLAGLDQLVTALDRARERDAHERCRRFESARFGLSPAEALRHVEARAVDLAQPRPEYGHATNAVAVIGRRARTRGLFLDRRAFLVSYDPSTDAEGRSLASVLGSVVPVGAGINLEYYFSYVDPLRFGSGTKLPHNITGLVGVMDGYSSDLRTGLPWQMVEIHEPVRLLTVVEAKPEVVLRAVATLPEVARLVAHSWVRVVALDPDSADLFVYQDGQFVPYEPSPHELPTAPSSQAWYAGHRDPLPIARVGLPVAASASSEAREAGST